MLSGKVAIVTGGSRGIGRAVAERFRAMGATVIITGRGARTQQAADGLGYGTFGVRCDVSDENDVVALFDDAVERFGRVDVLVNNAGVARDAMIHRMSLADFQEVVDTNLLGTWLCTRAAVAHMLIRDGGGSIVNVSSISGKVGNFGQSNYAASKAGVVALTKSVAREGARANIRANAILPGFIDTDMTSGLGSDARKRLLKDVPLGRPGRPAEVAEVALFLAADMSSYVTGAVIDCSGGRHM